MSSERPDYSRASKEHEASWHVEEQDEQQTRGRSSSNAQIDASHDAIRRSLDLLTETSKLVPRK